MSLIQAHTGQVNSHAATRTVVGVDHVDVVQLLQIVKRDRGIHGLAKIGWQLARCGIKRTRVNKTHGGHWSIRLRVWNLKPCHAVVAHINHAAVSKAVAGTSLTARDVGKERV